MRATQLTDPLAYHAEGPVWVTGTRWPDGLYWVDMLAGDVLHLEPSGVVTRRHINAIAAVIRPRTNGGLVYAIERGFAMDDGPDTPLRLLPDQWRDPSVRMNEGGCDPAGAFYCGSMTYQGEAGRGTLYRLAPDGMVSAVETGFGVPNGLEWAPTGERAYHVDTPTQRIDLLDWDPVQGLHNRRPFVAVEGRPDGLCLDTDGGIWVAVNGSSVVHRYTPEGSLSEVVELPVAQVTACSFGGVNMDELFITTSRENMTDPEPEAGAVFTVAAAIRGLSVRPYGG